MWNDQESWLSSAKKLVSRSFRSCFKCMPCLVQNRRVNPFPQDGQLHCLSNKRKIRVIHIDGRTGGDEPDFGLPATRLSVMSNSSTSSHKEYWFTRWNRPLKYSDTCRCSENKSISKPVCDLKQDCNTATVPYVVNDVPKMQNSFDLYIDCIIDTAFKEAMIELFPPLSSRLSEINLNPSSNVVDCSSDNNCDTQGYVNHCYVSSADDQIEICIQSDVADNDSGIHTCSSVDSSSKSKKGPGRLKMVSIPRIVNSVRRSSRLKEIRRLKEAKVEACVVDDTQSVLETDSMKTIPSKGVDTGFLRKVVKPREQRPCDHFLESTNEKPLLMFLHGIGASADVWIEQLKYFSNEGFEVIAPDMIGHGFSSTPVKASAYTFHHLLKDSLDIFDQFVPDCRKCVVIGHSYGSCLAAAVARYRSQQVTQLVLICGGGPAPLAPRCQESDSPCIQALLKPLLLCGFKRDILFAPCGKHMEPCPELCAGIPSYVLQFFAEGQDWPEGDATFHRRIQVPTLLVYGLRDPFVTLVQECEMERTIPRSFLELISEAGHLPMLETPNQLSHMIHCFVSWWAR